MPLGASGLSMSSWRTVMMTSGCLMALGALPARAYASTVSAQWLHAIGIHLEAREEHLPGQKQFPDDVWLQSLIRISASSLKPSCYSEPVFLHEPMMTTLLQKSSQGLLGVGRGLQLPAVH